MELNDQQLLRYSRHILLPELGINGQQQLLNSHIILFGLGGLGSPVALYLAAAGVGRMTLVDPDVVEVTNLQRQIAHFEENLGQQKVSSGAQQIHRLNSATKVITIAEKLENERLSQEIDKADLVLDCIDNHQGRFAINQACVKTKTPLISAAAIRWQGQISVYNSQDPNGPCYHCIYGGRGETDQSCSQNGVLSPLLGVLGSMQAVEAIKLLTETGEPLVGRVLLLDALSMQWETMQLARNPACPVCSNRE